MSLQDDIALMTSQVASVPEALWNSASAASGYAQVQQDYLNDLSVCFQRQDSGSFQSIKDRVNNVYNALDAEGQAAFKTGSFTQGPVQGGSTWGQFINDYGSAYESQGGLLGGLGSVFTGTNMGNSGQPPAGSKPPESKMSFMTLALIGLAIFLVYKFV